MVLDLVPIDEYAELVRVLGRHPPLGVSRTGSSQDLVDHVVDSIAGRRLGFEGIAGELGFDMGVAKLGDA